MRNYNTKVSEMDEDGYGPELFTIDEWKETLKWGWINEYDGSAYWVKDGMESSDSVFDTEQEDATHVVFYGV